MKRFIKHKLSELGVFPLLNRIRYRKAIRSWVGGGYSGIAPPPIKRQILCSYLQRYHLNRFIETGTHVGDTLAMIAQKSSVESISIELSNELYSGAIDRFKRYKNVTVIHGDSKDVLPKLVSETTKPTLFWLDGHYSGEGTAHGELATPISLELDAILSSPIRGHVILIDDARCFTGTEGYPHLSHLLSHVEGVGNYEIEISADIIRLTPRI